MTFAGDAENDLVIAIGFASAAGVQQAASAYPQRNLVIIDSVIDLANVASVTFKEHEGSFLAGAMAALTTSTDKLGFLGGLDIPLINKYASGFEQGAHWVNPNITITYAYSPDPANPWGDIAGGKAVAETFLTIGVDIIYTAAGGTSLGVFEAVDEANLAGGTTYAIGVDTNQDHLKQGSILTSMVKKVDVAVKSQIDSLVSGTWENGTFTLGLKEGGVAITDMEFTQAEANTVCGNTTRLDFVNSLGDLIANGDIVVDENIVDPNNYNQVAHNCDSDPDPTTSTAVSSVLGTITTTSTSIITTPTSTSTVTTTTTSTPVSTSTATITTTIGTSTPPTSTIIPTTAESTSPIVPGFVYGLTIFVLLISVTLRTRTGRN